MNKQEFKKYLDRKYRIEGLRVICRDYSIVHNHLKLKDDILNIIVEKISYEEFNKSRNKLSLTRLMGIIPFIVACLVLWSKIIDYKKPYGEVEGWPNSFWGTLILSSIDDQTTVLFNGKRTLLSDGFCYQNINTKNCQISMSLSEPNILGSRKIIMNAKFYCPNGEICGEILQNSWIIDKTTKLKPKFDEFAAELYDTEDNTIFKIEYDKIRNEIRVYGIFYDEEGSLILSVNSLGHKFGYDFYLSEASSFKLLNIKSLRPIFKHNSLGPNGERIKYSFDNLKDHSNDGNTLFVLDKSTKNNEINYKLFINRINEKLLEKNIQIRSWILESDEFIGENLEQIQAKTIAIGHKWANHYDYIISFVKLKDGNYLMLLAKTNGNKIIYAFDDSNLPLIENGNITNVSLEKYILPTIFKYLPDLDTSDK